MEGEQGMTGSMIEHCSVCGRVCWDRYVVKPEVWKAARLKTSDICHLDCLSKRLGRELSIEDFNPTISLNHTLIFGYHMGRRPDEKGKAPDLPPTGS